MSDFKPGFGSSSDKYKRNEPQGKCKAKMIDNVKNVGWKQISTSLKH